MAISKMSTLSYCDYLQLRVTVHFSCENVVDRNDARIYFERKQNPKKHSDCVVCVYE